MSDPLRRPTVIDMTPEGEFRTPAPPGRGERLLRRIGGAAFLVALVAGGLCVAALAFVVLGLLLPVAVVAGAVAFAVLWWKLRQARRQGRPAFVVMRR
ncbi:hypothetical protein [Roseomonas sp. BN140053]|uniref:hypothetical protein n=1 Tax=Roseomonas sp. BN140053 TaxID=3391898 RepID=UPI0039E86B74